MAKILSMSDLFMNCFICPLDHNLGSQSCPTQTPLRVCRLGQNIGNLNCDVVWTLASSVKDQKTKSLVFCNLIGEDQGPLDLRSYCGTTFIDLDMSHLPKYTKYDI